MYKHTSIMALLLWLSPIATSAQQFAFPTIPGPYYVQDGSPVLLTLNTSSNSVGVPCASYGPVEVSLIRLDPTVPNLNTPTTVTLNYSGGQVSKTYYTQSFYADSTFFYFDFILQPDYDPCINGGLYLTISQNGTGYGADFIDIQTNIEVTVLGCIDVAASNYDPNANVDNGSCVYPPPPSNNDCFSAIPLTLNANNCNGAYTNGTDIGATASTPYGVSCGYDYGAGVDGDVWFTVPIVNASLDLVISTDFGGGTHTDTEIGVLRGTSCSNLTAEIACGQDIDNSNWLTTIVIPSSDLIAGETLFIVVDRYYDQTPPGTFCIEAYNVGCTDPTASNYQPTAIEDNGSCLFTPQINSEGDIYLENPIASGIVLRSSDGKCWRTTVDTNGNLSTVEVPCP